MTITAMIDWSKAPEWADGHGILCDSLGIRRLWYGDDQFAYIGQEGSPLPWGGGVGDTRHNPTKTEVKYKEERPKPWNGFGLPSAGTECLAKRVGAAEKFWRKVLILCVGEHRVFYRDPDGDELSRSHGEMEWAPIRTPVQIADDARKKAIEEMHDVWRANYEGHVKDGLYALYDAGYRKQVAS